MGSYEINLKTCNLIKFCIIRSNKKIELYKFNPKDLT